MIFSPWEHKFLLLSYIKRTGNPRDMSSDIWTMYDCKLEHPVEQTWAYRRRNWGVQICTVYGEMG